MKPAPVHETVTRQLSIRHLVLGLLALVGGVALLIGGVAANMLWMSAIGVVVMFGGVWYALAGVTTEKVSVSSGASPKKSQSDGKKKGFMARQAEEWEKRRRDFGNGRGRD